MISNRNIMKLESRREIYNFILKNPGIHLREISRQNNIPKTTLRHHLKYLNKQGLITVKSENRFKRYYATNKLGTKEKEILDLLRQEVPHNILLYMTFYIICSEKELSEALGKHPATIDFHLKKLKNLGIIKNGWGKKNKINMKNPVDIRRRININEKIYYLEVENYYIIYNLLTKCKKSLPNQDFVNELLRFVYEYYYLNRSKRCMSPRNLVFNMIKNPDNALDGVVNVLWEICPHPYHM